MKAPQESMLSTMNIGPKLEDLGLSIADASRLLHITERTLRRYMAASAAPGPVVQCLLAWEVLKAHGLPWPGAVSRYYVRDHRGTFVLADPQPTQPPTRGLT